MPLIGIRELVNALCLRACRPCAQIPETKERQTNGVTIGEETIRSSPSYERRVRSNLC